MFKNRITKSLDKSTGLKQTTPAPFTDRKSSYQVNDLGRHNPTNGERPLAAAL